MINNNTASDDDHSSSMQHVFYENEAPTLCLLVALPMRHTARDNRRHIASQALPQGGVHFTVDHGSNLLGALGHGPDQHF